VVPINQDKIPGVLAKMAGLGGSVTIAPVITIVLCRYFGRVKPGLFMHVHRDHIFGEVAEKEGRATVVAADFQNVAGLAPLADRSFHEPEPLLADLLDFEGSNGCLVGEIPVASKAAVMISLKSIQRQFGGGSMMPPQAIGTWMGHSPWLNPWAKLKNRFLGIS